MRRKLTTLKAKGGHSENGAPRQLIDEAVYREHASITATSMGSPAYELHYDPSFSGWSNASRPRDYAISLRAPSPVNHVVGVGVVS